MYIQDRFGSYRSIEWTKTDWNCTRYSIITCLAQTSDSLARLTQTLARMPDVMDMRERNIKGVGTSGTERCHLYEDQAQHALDRPVVEKTTTSCLAEGHSGSWCPLRVLPLTLTHRHLRWEWRHTRRNWTAAEWNQVVFGDEFRFNLSSDENRVHVWRPRGVSILHLLYSDTLLPQLV
ncbi:transposable element Tcb1 transposase [Trichonephila clavipes]|nr:transposable element Tcb1 transposase [Trichonephila clavipes]